MNKLVSFRLEFLRKRGMLEKLTLSDDEITDRMIRTSGLCVCLLCMKQYYEHPYVENLLDNNGNPFLHIICDGSIVKL